MGATMQEIQHGEIIEAVTEWLARRGRRPVEGDDGVRFKYAPGRAKDDGRWVHINSRGSYLTVECQVEDAPAMAPLAPVATVKIEVSGGAGADDLRRLLAEALAADAAS